MNRRTRIRAAERRGGDEGAARLILGAYRHTGGNAQRAAARLDVSVVQLRRWVRKLGLQDAVESIRGS